METVEVIQNLIKCGYHSDWCPAFKHRFQECQCGREYAVEQAKKFLEVHPAISDPPVEAKSEEPKENHSHDIEKITLARVECAGMRHALRVLVDAVGKRNNFWVKLQGIELPWLEIHARRALSYTTGIKLYSVLQSLRNEANWSGSAWRGSQNPTEMLNQVMGQEDEAMDFNSVYSQPI